MKTFKRIFFQAVCIGIGLSLCLPAMAAEDCGGFAGINPYPFGHAFAWGGPNTGNNASTLDFVSTWVGYEINGGLNGACDGCRQASALASKNAMLVYYAYFIGFQANLMGGFGDCNVDNDGHNLCTDGAQWIRENWDVIVQIYGEYAKRTYEVSPEKPVIWWLEGDFVQYSYPTQSHPLSMAELGQLARDITCAIKANEPNAVVAMNHSPWISNEQADAFWSAMPMDVIDLVWVQGAGDTETFVNSGSTNAATANFAWLFQKAGTPIMAETSYAAFNQPDRWSTTSAANINARIAQGVIAVLVNHPNADYQAHIERLNGKLNDVYIDGEPPVAAGLNAFPSAKASTVATVSGNAAKPTAAVNAAKNASIRPKAATFDKNPAKQKNIAVTLTLNGNTLRAIKKGSRQLAKGADYSVSGKTVFIKKSYLAKLPVGKAQLTFDFSAGTDPVLTVTVKDSKTSDILSPQRRTDWSPGIAGNFPRKPVEVNVMAHGAVGDGKTDESNAFIQAIRAIPASGGTMIIPQGTYLIKKKLTIDKSILIKGAGFNQTRLLFDLGRRAENCIEFVKYDRGDWIDIKAGYTKGSQTLVVQTPEDFRAGDFVEIKQENDPVSMYTRPEWDQSWAQNAVGQICRVESILADGTLTLNRPLHFTYRSALHPQIRTLGMITYPGAEDFYIERLDAGDGHTIQMRYVAYGRLARIESNMTYRTHLYLSECYACEVRNE